MKKAFAVVTLLVTSLAWSQSRPLVRGMNLTQLGQYIYDAATPGAPKTPAQIAVDEIKKLGATHVVLNPQAKMIDPRGSDIIPDVPVAERNNERNRYKRLIDYIHSQGMTVGIRPIFFVIKPDGTFPYTEAQSDGSVKVWWHGNIQPADVNRWFESFKQYHDIYLLIAKLNKVEEYTIGAELYSMTVGIEDQWKEFPYGFPGKWLQLLRYSRSKLGNNVRIMYDVNFTDDRASSNGDLTAMGGEFERWRYRLVDLANPTNPEERAIWQDLVTFWNELDAVGIDMYRSLASKQDSIPTGYKDLVSLLKIRSDEYAGQVDTAMAEIESVTGKPQFMIFKEAGFRSVDRGFINPFDYETGQGIYREEHQAASFEALFQSFWEPRFSWFQGASFWDVSVSPARNSGTGDTGFSPVGKKQTVSVLRKIFSFN
ncbi:MAG: hypothetical protein AB7I27_06040 [Bacteriovoracaceae bacterium]